MWGTQVDHKVETRKIPLSFPRLGTSGTELKVCMRHPSSNLPVSTSAVAALAIACVGCSACHHHHHHHQARRCGTQIMQTTDEVSTAGDDVCWRIMSYTGIPQTKRYQGTGRATTGIAIEDTSRDGDTVKATMTTAIFRAVQKKNAGGDLPSARAAMERGCLPPTGRRVPDISDQFREVKCVVITVAAMMELGITTDKDTPMGDEVRDVRGMLTTTEQSMTMAQRGQSQ